ncbi:hypothetical protein [Amycolatopsis suaedae]|uniref:Uncharacterized protein n=1 Tax=Amycolatopsis suaedae TaxID=2510978 RepID=A0A4Q7JBA9_9PSEU|nr:hypothetical protein [Amycolatopsis suaedae]RZQ63534.1 hypothetical protein EWH70_14005 [Amycolatopsis suaedae]
MTAILAGGLAILISSAHLSTSVVLLLLATSPLRVVLLVGCLLLAGLLVSGAILLFLRKATGRVLVIIGNIGTMAGLGVVAILRSVDRSLLGPFTSFSFELVLLAVMIPVDIVLLLVQPTSAWLARSA